MPLNPNIALSVKGIELQDPLVQYGKVAAIQNAQNQNALTQYQLGTAQRAETAQNVLADAYSKSIDPTTGKIDYNKLNSLVAAGGGGAQLPAIQKLRMEQETAALTQQETGFKVQKAKKDFIAQAQRDTSQNPSDANITAYKEDLIANPLFSEQEKQQMIASSDRLLAMPINERKMFMSSQGATASELKPTVSVGRTGIVQTPAFGGAGMVVPGTGAAFQATPGETMADARARQKMAQDERQFGISQANKGVAGAAPLKPLTEAQTIKLRTDVGKDYKSATTALSQMDDLLTSIQQVKTAPGLSAATGYIGKYLPSRPEGAAAQAETRLANLRGKVTALGKATAAMSGSIGSIANQEWKILADQIAVLDEVKGKGPLLEQIDLLESQAKGAAERIRDAYEKTRAEDFERFPQFRDLPKSKAPGAPAAASPNIDALLNKYK